MNVEMIGVANDGPSEFIKIAGLNNFKLFQDYFPTVIETSKSLKAKKTFNIIAKNLVNNDMNQILPVGFIKTLLNALISPEEYKCSVYVNRQKLLNLLLVTSQPILEFNQEITVLFFKCFNNEIVHSLKYINNAIHDDDYEDSILKEHIKISSFAVTYFKLSSKSIKYNIMGVRENIKYEVDIRLREIPDYYELYNQIFNTINYGKKDQLTEWHLL